MDNIVMKRIWEDEDFFQVYVEFSTSRIKINFEQYLWNEVLDELISSLCRFIEGKEATCSWKIGEAENSAVPLLSLCFFSLDKCGHVGIKVNLEFDESFDYTHHKCSFYMKTEMGLLCVFVQNLQRLENMNIGEEIALVD